MEQYVTPRARQFISPSTFNLRGRFPLARYHRFPRIFLPVFGDNLKSAVDIRLPESLSPRFSGRWGIVHLLLELCYQFIAFDKLVTHVIFHAVGPVYLSPDIAGNQEWYLLIFWRHIPPPPSLPGRPR